MARAIRLARAGLYTTHPNPRVGCVLVGPEGVIGEGHHRRAGEPHAERIALAAAGALARGATAYVTLEPCCHQGRTGPCTEALIQAGVARVVVAMRDPNPLVAGNGLRQLRQAGIRVEQGVLEEAAAELNPGFIRRMEQRRPLVRCKLAMSLDGRTAMASGESQWITGEAARQDVQRLRARSSAVVTGIGTILADDPSMNVRLAVAELQGVEQPDYLRQPLRVILDSELRTPPTARLLRLPGDTLIVCGEGASGAREQALCAAGAEIVRRPQDDGRVQLPDLMQLLAARAVNEVLIEAGPTLAGHALQARLVDELIVYMAPHLMGQAARGLVALGGMERMADRLQLTFDDVRHVGSDIRIRLRPNLEN